MPADSARNERPWWKGRRRGVSAALGRHADVDLYPGHALSEVGNVGAHRAHIVPNFRDIASQCGVFAARRAAHGLDFST